MAKLLGQAMEDKTEMTINGIGDFFRLFNSSEWKPIFITAGIIKRTRLLFETIFKPI